MINISFPRCICYAHNGWILGTRDGFACHSKVKEEFIVLSVVNDNISGEKGPQLVCLWILRRFLFAAFSPTTFCSRGIVPAFQSLKMYPVSSTMSLYSAGGRRKKEKRNCGNCSKPGHTIECNYTTDFSGWLDSSNDPRANKVSIVRRCSIPNQSHKLISPLHMASVIPSFSTKCCQRGPPLSFRRR